MKGKCPYCVNEHGHVSISSMKILWFFESPFKLDAPTPLDKKRRRNDGFYLFWSKAATLDSSLPGVPALSQFGGSVSSLSHASMPGLRGERHHRPVMSWLNAFVGVTGQLGA